MYIVKNVIAKLCTWLKPDGKLLLGLVNSIMADRDELIF